MPKHLRATYSHALHPYASAELAYPVFAELAYIVSAELAYSEGVERLIGQGWREATTLSNGSFEDY